MNQEDYWVERIKKLDRLYLAQQEALDAYHRDPTEINERRWSFLFRRYAALRDELGVFSGELPS